MCIGGIWEVIWVDDYFPCYKDTGPIFCQSKSNELWVMVLEKVWAKAFGSYNLIIAGHPATVLRSLTGGVTWSISTNDENFEQKFRDGMNMKCVMCSGTKNDKELEKLGFVEGHAYSVLKIYDDPELQTKDKDLKLMKIRNPWGEKEWK
jgi:calpain-15